MRYQLQEIRTGFYQATDTVTHAYVTFEKGKFQETQEWQFPADPNIANPTSMHRIANRIEGWVMWHHREIAAPPEKFIVQLSEDGQTVRVIRQASPRMEITFPADISKEKAAAKLQAAAMWLKKSADYWDNVDF